MSIFSYLRRLAPCTVFLVTIAAGALNAQASAAVTGKVSTNAGEPIVGAFISLDDAPPIAQTNEAGEFRIDGVPAGSHVLHVRRGGFAEAIDSVVVAANSNVARTITLSEK